MRHPLCELRVLNLSFCCIGRAALKALAGAALPALDTLLLAIAGLMVEHDGMETIADAL